MNENPNYYAILPANVRYDKNLSANEKLFYAEITALAQQDGVCSASNGYFAELYGVSRNTISRWINQLKDSGYVTTETVYNNGAKEVLIRLQADCMVYAPTESNG